MHFSKYVFVYTFPSKNYVVLLHSISLKKVYLSLKKYRNLDSDIELKEKLQKLGFFDDAYGDNLIKELKKKVKQKINVSYVLLTDACNLHCEYCYMTNGKGHNFMTYKVADNVIEKIKVLSKNKKLYRVYFYGGEPFLNKKVMFYIAEKLNSENIKFFVNTNGTLITDDDIKLLKKYRFHISISLDGNVYDNIRRGETYKVLSTIAKLKDAKVGIGISCTVTDTNYLHLADVVKFFHDLGITSFGFNLPLFSKKGDVYDIDPVLLADSMFEAFKVTQKYGMRESRVGVRRWYHLVTEEFRIRDCAAQGAQVFFSTDGKVGPCHGFHDDVNFMSNDLNSNLFKEFIDVPIYNDKCLTCPAVGVCGGACQYNVYVKTGKRTIIDPDYCAFMKRLLYNLLDYYYDKYVNVFSFRKPSFEDISNLKEHLNSLGLKSISNIQNIDRWLSNIISSTINNRGASIIVTKDKIVGFIALAPMRNRTFEVFIGIDKEHRNQGLGTKLVRLLLYEVDRMSVEYNFDFKKIIKIRVRKDNTPSRRLFSKFCKQVGEEGDYLIYRFV